VNQLGRALRDRLSVESEDRVALLPGYELLALLRATLADYKRPRWIEFVTDLPKTATGKIQRHKLRDRTTAR
jgi:non-ribosomal peptide synthetase component E (peptide arylation enzyme)